MDPLAQLKDIHLPTDVHSYPIAPGWWLLAVIVLALMVYGALKLRQYIVKRKAQKTALKQLANSADISTMMTVLKWAALQYFPRQQVAHLTGNTFKAFLTATLPAKQQEKFNELSGASFTSVYQSDVANQTTPEFIAAAQLWLRHALPPKQDFSMNEIASSKLTQVNENNGVKP